VNAFVLQPGEPAASVAVAELPHEPRRGLTRRPSQAHRRPGLVLEHDLRPSIAEESFCRRSRNRGSLLDLALGELSRGIDARVEHHGCPIGIGVGRD
jgi:hypothetical protein